MISIDIHKKIIIYFFTNKRIININQFRYGKDSFFRRRRCLPRCSYSTIASFNRTFL
nr:MAG TPA: hypothetical protein [Bacteriophage sp.]